MQQSHEPQRLFRSKALAGLALGAVIVAILAIASIRGNRRPLWGDEGTFVAMTASLVEDGDLVFDETDATRLAEHPDDPSPTVILQKTDVGVTFSKPILYSLISAPLFALFGEFGMRITNAVALGLALVLAWLYLSRLADSGRAFWTLCSFLCTSAILAYLGWRMSDLVLLSMTLAGLVLALGGRSLEISGRQIATPFAHQAAAVMGGLLLGGAVSMRFTSAALAAAAVGALVFDRRWRRATVVGILSLAGFLSLSAASTVLLGTANPYKAVRSSFNETTGYPAGPSTEQISERFTSRPATQSATWRPRLDVSRTAYSTLYFFIGRHTGVLFYFPIALVLLIHILRRPDPVSLSLLAGVAAIVGFYLLWMPENYFGGSTFVGNRYLLGAVPALLVASTRLPSRRSLAFAWILALVSWSSAVHSTYVVRHLDSSSQAHAHSGIFRQLPFESTAQRIDGLNDRFWADDFVRFLDPYATPAEWSFRLDSSRPAAELLLATDWSDRPFYFAVSPSTAPVMVEIDGADRRTSYSIPQPSPDPPGLLSVPFSNSWRHHSYWWKPGKPYDTQLVRFSLDTGGDEPVTAVVRYAGKGRELAPLAAEILTLDPPLPTETAAGVDSTVVVSLRNTGRQPWKASGLFPVRLGYRMVTGPQGKVHTRGFGVLPSNVGPGDTVEVPLTLEWPEESGTFQLALDLVREPAGALGELGRLTLAVEEVRSELPASPNSPTP